MGKIINLNLNSDVENLLNKELSGLKNPFFSAFVQLGVNEKQKIFETFISSGFQALMADFDLVQSVIEMFKHNLCISETSRDAFIHRNTLIYRLDKIKKLSGLDVRNFYDAELCKTLMIVYLEGKKMGL